MASVSERKYYTSSEAMRMLIQPSALPPPLPKLNHSSSLLGRKQHQPANAFRSARHPNTNSIVVFEPLLRPSLVRCHSADTARRFSYSFAPQLKRVETKTDRNSKTAVRAPPRKRSWFDRRSNRTDGRSYSIGPAVNLMSYSSFGDPHLRRYYDRLLSSNDRRPPSQGRKELADYDVGVTIGERKDAGSRASVFVRLNGENGVKVNKQRLTSKKRNMVPTDTGYRYRFLPGSDNHFKIRGPSIHHLESIVVETDALLPNEGVFIEELSVRNLKTQQIWQFYLGDWLSLYESDCQISRTLRPDSPVTQYTATIYDIAVVTGGKFGAGTDAHVFITLYGEAGVAPRQQLYRSDHESPFERGQTDNFVLETKDVGRFRKIRIEHDNTGKLPGWFLEQITVTNRRSNLKGVFRCQQWLAKNEGDGRICRDLLPTSGSGGTKLEVYRIILRTGDERGAGTDSNVFLTIFGSDGDSGEFQLKGKGNLFERNNVDTFEQELPDVGDLSRVRIRHDNTGIGPGWFLASIEIAVGGVTYDFPCQRWLSKTEDDGEISRELVVVGNSGGRGGAKSTLTSYELTIETGDVRFAGTSAEVYVELIRDQSESERRSSKSVHDRNGSLRRQSSSANCQSLTSGRVVLEKAEFERGKTDVVRLETADGLSPLSALRVGHDNSGRGAGWFLNKITVFCPATGIEQHFVCGQWLATDEGDGLIERTLKEDVTLRKERQKQTVWDLAVYTSDISGAGTDANVFIVVFGEKGVKSEIVPLTNEGDKFEAGSVDRFVVETPPLNDHPTKIVIWHDNVNPAAGWHLDKVELVNRKSAKKYTFLCGRWLATDEDDGEIVRELPATGTGIKKPLKVVSYSLSVKTGDKFGAGTNADVHCCLFGEDGDTTLRQLRKSSANTDKFERNQTDVFTIEACDLGKLNKLRIGHNNEGIGAGWFLNNVGVIGPNANVSFPCNRWLAEDEEDGQLEIDLFPGDPSDNTQHRDMLATTTYVLSIATGDVKHGGTNANVYCEIVGKNGESTGKIELKSADNIKDPFERGRTDIFTVQREDVGKIDTLKIGHDGTGLGAGWFLESVELKVPSRGEVYQFPCRRWLEVSENDGQLQVDLTPSEVEKGQKEIPYEVTICTGDVKGAGTNANVFLQIYSSVGNIKTKQFDLSNRSDIFERAAVDVFKLEGEDVGIIGKIRVGHDGRGLGSGWFLASVKIRKPKTPRERNRSEPKPPLPKRSISEQLKRKRSVSMLKRRKSFRRETVPGSSTSDSDSEQGSSGGNEDDFDEDESSQSNSSQSESETESKSESDDSNSTVEQRSKKGGYGRRFSTRSGGSSRKGSSVKLRRNESVDSKTSNDETETYYFLVNRWLAQDEDDGEIVRELLPTDEMGQPIGGKHASSELLIYELHVFTGNVSGAGTDANVFVDLHGDCGDTGERQLKQSLTATNKFERNQEDVFEVSAVDLGELKKLKVWHDNSGLGAAWYLDKIEVVIDGNVEKKYIFPCEMWLSTKNDDGQVCRELVPLSKRQLKRKNTSVSLKDEFGLEMSALKTAYEVSVTTGTVRGAGTDANVYCILHGNKGDSGKVLLKTSRTNSNKFESGQTDVVAVESIEIGENLERLTIGHDNKGGFSDWFLDSVRVDCPQQGKTWREEPFWTAHWA